MRVFSVEGDSQEVALEAGFPPSDPYSQRRRSMLAVLLGRHLGGGWVGVIVLALCGAGLGYGYLLHKVHGPQPANGGSSLALVCSMPPQYFPENSPYQGAGPHPIAVFHLQDQNREHRLRRVDFTGVLPGSGFSSVDSQVQIVACSDRIEELPTGLKCDFQGTSAELYDATYRVRLMEARTGSFAGSLLVHPSLRRCPTFAVLNSRSPRAYVLPSPDDYMRAAQQTVNGWANEDS